MQPIILVGHGGNYVDIVDTIEDINAAEPKPRYVLLGFLDNREEAQGRSFHGLPVLGRYADAGRFGEALFSSWIGGTGTYLQRPQVIASLGLPPDPFLTLVNPTSC